MKRIIIKKIYEKPFEAIKKGTKTFEIRANKNEFNIDSINLLKLEDIIIFTKINSDELLICTVENILIYKNVRELLESLGVKNTLSSTSNIEDGIKSIESIKNYKQLILKNGLFAIKLKHIKFIKKPKFIDYKDGDYDKYIKDLTKENMEQHFITNFGGWSDLVSEKKFMILADNGFIKLIFLKDIFIGYITFNKEKKDANSYLINDLHIIKEFQKKGYGTLIIKHAIDIINEIGGNNVKIFVFLDNPSIEFYKKMGFKETEVLEKSNTSVMNMKITNKSDRIYYSY